MARLVAASHPPEIDLGHRAPVVSLAVMVHRRMVPMVDLRAIEDVHVPLVNRAWTAPFATTLPQIRQLSRIIGCDRCRR